MTIAELRELLSRFDDDRMVLLEGGAEIVAHDDGDVIFIGSPEALAETFSASELALDDELAELAAERAEQELHDGSFSRKDNE